jgi:hypothetical protein
LFVDVKHVVVDTFFGGSGGGVSDKDALLNMSQAVGDTSTSCPPPGAVDVFHDLYS